jgi:hypothetical protein
LFRWACECTDKSVPFRKYCLSRPLAFSFDPRCAEIATVTPTGPFDTTGRGEPSDKLEGVEVPNEAIEPCAVAPAANTGSAQAIANAGPARDFAARSYRERGIFAYREGDLYRAIADFDLAIQHDPSFADAYIDRGIVFYRMHEFDRAFADIAQAKPLTRPNQDSSAGAA